MTNADHFRAMSDEELAMVLMCPNEMEWQKYHVTNLDNNDCYKCLLEWLGKEG